jgi:CheY-like chemotaxis protein
MDNLLHNASKFTDPGGRVRVGVAQDPNRPQALVTVADTGIGIEPELLPVLFKPFAQADRSLDRSRGGLGLGLALVKGLVHLHGGEVRVASAGPGRGTEFTLTLPLDHDTASVVPAAAPPPKPPQAGRRVMVIEDNRDAAETLRLMLELWGHQVALAFTGPAGIEMARGFHPEVILCDLGLPGMDGFAVARELRGHADMASVRLIAVSGYGQDEDRSRAREAGFDFHLTKPVDPQDLESLLATTPFLEDPSPSPQPHGRGPS